MRIYSPFPRNPSASPPLILPFLKGVPGFSRGRDLIRKGRIKIPHGRAKRYWAEFASLALCRLKGQDFEPLLRLRSDEMDNRVTHFASSLVVIKVKCEEPLFRLRSDEMDNRVTHFGSSLVVIKRGRRFAPAIFSFPYLKISSNVSSSFSFEILSILSTSGIISSFLPRLALSASDIGSRFLTSSYFIKRKRKISFSRFNA